MRAILFILILAVAALIAAFATGYLKIDQTQPAEAPTIDADSGGVSASGGQAPSFDVETGSVSVGTEEVTVPLPTVEVTPPAEQPESNSSSNASAE